MTRPGTSVLIHAPNWLGDLVMSTVLLERCEAAGIRPHVLVRRRWRPLLEKDPRIAGIVDDERPGRHAGLPGLVRLASDLRSGPVGYATVLVVPPSLRAAAVARLSGIPCRIGHSGDGRSALLNPAVPRPVRGVRHYCDEIDDLWQIFQRTESAVPMPRLAGCEPRDGIAPEGRTWALAVGATYGSAKIWPAAVACEFVKLCRASGVRLLVLGDESARSHVREIQILDPHPWNHLSDASAGPVDMTGTTSLTEVVQVLNRVGVFVGNDSGLMHLAAALGTPTLGLFGSTNPDWTRPRGPRAEALVVEGFACSPCHRRACNQARFCMETLTADVVHGHALALEEGKC